MTDIKLPLAFSAAGHTIVVALLVLLLHSAPPLPEPIAKGGIEVAFAPALPKAETAPLPTPPVAPEIPPPPDATPPPPEPQAETAPPPTEPPVVATQPVSPAPETPVTAREPPPPPKPVAKKLPKPPPRHQEMPQPTQAYAPPTPQAPAVQTPVAPPQTAAAATPVPAPVPSPEATAGYRALLSAWLESHKRYPETARERGEQGHAVLRFEVDRSGRVLDYAVTSSSGYPELDQSIEEMMRGATLPPFPAGMTQPRMQVSVTIRFSLTR